MSGNYHPTPLLETQTDYPQDLPARVNPYFPLHTFDADSQQLDLRPINSWLLKLDQVSPIELVEVQLVNAIASLLLGTNAIGDTGASEVAQLIQHNPRLEVVYLGCNAISEIGVASLAKALTDNQFVTGLWLKRNPIGTAGA